MEPESYSPQLPLVETRGGLSIPALDDVSPFATPLRKLLGEHLERPLSHARSASPQEAQAMSEIYARIALACGSWLLEQISGNNSHELFDSTLEHAQRLFDAATCEDVIIQSVSSQIQAAIPRQSSADFMDIVDDLQSKPSASKISAMRIASSFESLDLDAPARQSTPLSAQSGITQVLSKAKLQQVLEQQGFKDVHLCVDFNRLWDAIGKEGVDLRTFHAVLRHLKLHLLCGSLPRVAAGGQDSLAIPEQVPELPEETGFIGVLDWCPRKIDDCYWHRPARPLDMFLTHRKPMMKMRWVHCVNVGRTTILRLAVKYQLHPLPVEDMIQLQQQSVPIVRKYNDNFFIIIPILRLTSESRQNLKSYREWRNARRRSRSLTDEEPAAESASENHVEAPQVEQCRIAIFAAGPPSYDTVISVMTEWKVSRLHADQSEGAPQEGEADESPARVAVRPVEEGSLPLPSTAASSRQARQRCAPRRYLADSIAGPSVDRVLAQHSTDVFEDVVRQIQRDYSMLRAGNSSWLLWRLLDVTVDELTPILSAYRAQLRWFSGLITSQEAEVSKDVEKRLLRSKVELDWLQRKVRPMIKVIKHLIRDKAIDPDVTRYLEDIEDHLNTFLEEVSRIIGVCNSLRDEMNSYRDRQQQKVLYVLTLVTTIVMPTHLLTGIFGMNWIDENGKPVVPGLGIMEEKRGYWLFWGTSMSLTIVIYFMFSRVLKWI
eukprot:TRINITY_DN36610_c0_g2_i1.p1 TRINITY_DN36610_c0_g2~~TRINITY_DN36610_c0_g2_i1.p1  ORF type:complete len:717 (-),score=146.00 TRINITY_DN36610_c0_g2_i1:57-2207(-)